MIKQKWYTAGDGSRWPVEVIKSPAGEDYGKHTSMVKFQSGFEKVVFNGNLVDYREGQGNDNTTSRAYDALIAAAPELLEALKGLNHMGGDERGGYCICPLKDGSAPDAKHATSCANARQVIAKAEGNR